ncbi:MAG: glycosyltransferase family 2 protein [Saprospiraceae bacterium]
MTFNEEIHISRVLESIRPIAQKVIVVDSHSTDHTVEIAQNLGAQILQNPFINQARQFQWAMDNTGIETAWVMRMDADEYLTAGLIDEIQSRLSTLDPAISGITLKRRVHFMGKWIKHGGAYPVKLLRIWRNGHAVIEQRWMDEHMVLIRGEMTEFRNDFIDENLNNLTWWVNKHNHYATREAVELLNQKYHFMNQVASPGIGIFTKQASQKKWVKKNLYSKMPLFVRSFFYFLFRFWLKFGFLDGRKGLMWHFLQGFWYRFLVDAKMYQIIWLSKKHNKSLAAVIREEFNLSIDQY